MIKMMQALFIVFLLPTTADALSCDYGIISFVPEDGRIDLPINTFPVVWVYEYTVTEDIELYNIDSSEQVELNITNIGGMTYSVTPAVGFTAGASYQFISTQEEWIFSSFSIGEQVDEEGPSKPIITGLNRDYGTDEWGDWDFLIVQIDEPEDALYYQVEVADNRNFTDSSMAIGTTLYGQIGVGSGPCGGNFPKQQVQDIHFVRITAYDIAGNPSVVSDTLEWDAAEYSEDERKGLGCHSIPTSNLSLWAFFGIVGMSIRRR